MNSHLITQLGKVAVFSTVVLTAGMMSGAAPAVIFKFDDLDEGTWEDFKLATDLCKAKGVTAGAGIFAKSVEDASQDYLDYVNELAWDPALELWMHGYWGNTSQYGGGNEYKGTPYDFQKHSFATGRHVILEKTAFLMRTYSEHWNGGDATTVRVFNEDPYYKVWMWPYGPSQADQQNIRSGADFLGRHHSLLEPGGTASLSDYNSFVTNYENYRDQESLVMQGHPWGWDSGELDTFGRIIDFLKSEGATFSNAWDYYKDLRGLTDTTASEPPAGVSLSRVDSRSIELTWDTAVDDETSIDAYLVYRDDVFTGITKETTYVDEADQDLTDDTEYQLIAVNQANLNSEKSNPISLNTVAVSGYPPMNARAAINAGGYTRIYTLDGRQLDSRRRSEIKTGLYLATTADGDGQKKARKLAVNIELE